MIVVDTNVASELMRPSPAPQVMRWAREQDPAALFTTSITVAEVLYGISRLPNGARKTQLELAADDVFAAFADRILPFDAAAAGLYAAIVDARERAGRPISGFDAQIAAVCRLHDAHLATRNGKDFAGTGLTILNPFEA